MGLPLDVAPLLSEFNVGPLTLRRSGAQTQNAYHEIVAGAEVSISVDPIVALPTPELDARQFPEAQRIAGLTTFIADVELRTADTGRAPDVIEYQGRDWHLHKLQDQSLNGAVWIAIGVAAERTV